MERPNKKISSRKEEISIMKDGKVLEADIEYFKEKTIIKFQSKEFFIKSDDKYKQFDLSWDDKFYRKIEELTGGKIIGCINCKFFAVNGLLYDQSHGYGGICVFEENNQDTRVTFDKDEPKEAFIREIDREKLKITGILDYCPKFILEEKQGIGRKKEMK